MGRRKRRGYARRDAEQWGRLLAEQEESGLSQRMFCDRRGLSCSSFYNWKRRFGVSDSKPELAAGFVEVALEPSRTQQWDVELTLGAGVVLRVRRR